MAMVRCERGHFFDREQEGHCPHCPDSVPSEPQARLVREDDDARTRRVPPEEGGPRTVRLRGGPEDVTVVPAPLGATPRPPPSGSGPPAASAGSETVAPKRRVWGGVPEAAPDVVSETGPVVGWLVCVEGAVRGRDFRLRSEGNFIGRGPENDVVVPGDDEISRFKHACVFFDPVRRSFVLHKGESTRKSLHLNGVSVYEPMALHAGDRVRLGTTVLCFLPFCGPDFGWDEPRRT